MDIRILHHAKQRMQAYNVDERMVEETIRNPDREAPGYGGRLIAQKKLDGYVLRVVYEKQNHQKVVITVYKAKWERYEM